MRSPERLLSSFVSLLSHSDVDEPYAQLTEFARVVAASDRAWYRTLDRGTQFITTALVDSDRGALPVESSMPVGRNLGTEAVRRLTTVYTEDLLNDDRIVPTEETRKSMTASGIRSVAVIPVTVAGVARGILCVGYRRKVPMSAQLRAVFSGLAVVASSALETLDEWKRTRTTIEELRTAVHDLDQRQAALARAFTLERRLVDRAAAGSNMDDLIGALAKAVGAPAVLANRFGSVIAYAGCDASNAVLLAARRTDGRHGVRVTADGRLLGQLSIGPKPSCSDEDAQLTLSVFSSACAVALARQRAVALSHLGQFDSLVSGLIEGRVPPSLAEEAHLLGIDLSRPHRVAVIRGLRRPVTRLAARQPVTEAHSFPDIVAEVVHLSKAGICVSWRGEDLIVLLPSADGPFTGGPRKLLEDMTSRLTSGLKGKERGARVGVGGICIEPADFARSYREAVMSLTVGTETSNEIMTFDDLGVSWLIQQVPRDALSGFRDRLLGDLRSYDQLHGSHLVESLRTFLQCSSDAVASAHRLGIHPNTMRYRLQRMREVSGLDLEQAEVRLGLEIALRTP